MLAAAEQLGETLAAKDDYHLVVVKSTVIPGMVEEEVVPAIEAASGKQEGNGFDVAVNPEFQSQGSAVEDFMQPDKIVLGTNGADDPDRALTRLHEVYAPLVERSGAPVVETGRREAAMIKYANNVFLASKISLINEIGNICKEYDVDAYEVADAIGLDERIGAEFLRSGAGFGGSCFPKDTKALIAAARPADYEPELLDAVLNINETQPHRMLELLDEHVNVAGKRVAVLGLAFKSGTDDTRGTRAFPIIDGLLDRGADVVTYDPVAMENTRERYPDITYVDSAATELDVDGPEVDRLRDLAAAHDISLVVGFAEQRGDRYHNTTAYITSQGEVTPYRKRHLWSGEADVFTPGEDFVIVETPAGTAGLVTCYDLNFVRDSVAFLDAGVDALFVVGAWPATHAPNWRLLVRARALDGVRWVVACGRTGRKEVAGVPTVEYAGRSLIVRPDGVVGSALAHAPDDLVTTFDSNVLAAQRDLVGVPVGHD